METVFKEKAQIPNIPSNRKSPPVLRNPKESILGQWENWHEDIR